MALSALAFNPRFARAPVRPIRNPRRPPNTAPCGTARDAPARDHVAAHASRDDGAAAAGVDHRRVAGSRARVTARGAGTPVRIAGNDRPRVSHRARVVTPPASERPATQRLESIFSTNPRQRLPKSSVDCHSSACPRGRRLRSSPACEARPPVTLEPLEAATNRSRTSCVTPRLGWFTQCVAGQSPPPLFAFLTGAGRNRNHDCAAVANKKVPLAILVPPAWLEPSFGHDQLPPIRSGRCDARTARKPTNNQEGRFDDDHTNAARRHRP